MEIVLLHAPLDLDGRPIERALAVERFVLSIITAAGFIPCTFAALLLTTWGRTRELYAYWASRVGTHRWRPSAIVSVSIAALLLVFTVYVKMTPYGYSLPLPLLVVPWTIGVVLMLATWFVAAAPVSFWSAFVLAWRLELTVAAVSLVTVWMLSQLARQAWVPMGNATFEASRFLLESFNLNVYLDLTNRALGLRDFVVEIAPQCSGYEGIGLVVGFLVLYIATFRQELKFPQVLLLFPFGILTIWLLNIVRIALIIVVGAYVSPEIAMHGFHSQAGWLMFLAVTLGILFGAHELSFFRKKDDQERAVVDPAVRLAAALLLPFIGLMAGRMIDAFFQSVGYWGYAVPLAFVSVILWIYRDVYRSLLARISPLALGLGAVVGIIWVLTDPGLGQSDPLQEWLVSLSPITAGAWLTIRVLGLVVLVPIAEELAFRGYLQRALTARRFEDVKAGQISVLAIVISSVLFGVLHERWLAGMLAGVVYGFLMMRSNRVVDPIASHMASNTVIAAAVLIGGQWSLL